MSERLQKIISRAGIASRRKAEELIVAGRVTVNGEVATQLGSRADSANDTVCVDGKVVHDSGARRYLVLNKPKGCVTTTDDPEGRTTVMDLLGTQAAKGLYPVGRLDYNTEGLLILTNDGDFSNQILSAKNKIPKTYQVKVSGFPSEEAIRELRHGIRLDGVLVRPESIRLRRDAENPWFEITLVQGRNRQIHRMFERIGFLVEKIRRVSIGNLYLKGLEPRQIRELSPKEVERLLNFKPRVVRESGDFERESRPRPQRSAQRSANLPGERRSGARRSAPPSGRSRYGTERPGERRSGRPGGTGSRRPDDRRPRYGAERSSESRSGHPDGTGSRRPSDRRPRRVEHEDRSGEQGSRRGAAQTNRLRREARPHQRPARRQPSGASSPARARTGGRAGSPGRSPARSRGPRSSHPGSRARP